MSQQPKALELSAHRCRNCNKILFMGDFIGSIEIKCNRCKQVSSFVFKNELLTHYIIST